jgi:hypothetical protein
MPVASDQERCVFHPSHLGFAQVSAIHALEILECVQVLLHSVEEDGNPLTISRICSGAYEIVELASSHIRDVEGVLTKAIDAGAQS